MSIAAKSPACQALTSVAGNVLAKYIYTLCFSDLACTYPPKTRFFHSFSEAHLSESGQSFLVAWRAAADRAAEPSIEFPSTALVRVQIPTLPMVSLARGGGDGALIHQFDERSQLNQRGT
jgi:hypothetical protein